MPKVIDREIAGVSRRDYLDTGLTNFLVNPDSLLLEQQADLSVYDKIFDDSHAGGVLQKRFLPIAKADWHVFPGEQNSKGTQIARFVKEVLESCNYDQARELQLKGIVYGFYPLEIMWEKRDGDILVKELLDKHPKHFFFDQNKNPRLYHDSKPFSGIPLNHPRKFIYYRYGSFDNPYGKGLGQSLYWPVWFKKNGVRYWWTFLDKYGAPTVVGKYPLGATDQEKDALLEAAQSFHTEGAVAIPESMKIELAEAVKSGAENFEAACNYMDKQISIRVLGNARTTESEKSGGSYGAVQSSSEDEREIFKADSDSLSRIHNNTLIKWIVDLNFGPQKKYPKVVIDTKLKKDKKQLAETYDIIINKIKLPVGEKHLREELGVPEPEEGENIHTSF
jgi:phage gp29-like protein